MDKTQVLAKITANPTENTWSQAYSTLNLYIVLSIKSDEGEIASTGKELFEKIQREYFSLDEKNLKNIKSSIEAAIGEFGETMTISLALATIQDDILYLITAGEAEATIKRGDKIGVIARGEEKNVIAFSGKLITDDIVVIQTSDFTKKVPAEKLAESLNTSDLTEISENLTPIIHAEPIGTEAALIMMYKNPEPKSSHVPLDTPEETKAITDTKAEETSVESHENKPESDFVKPKITLPKIPINLGFLKNNGKKKFIPIAIIALIILLIGSIYFENQRQENVRANAALTDILTPAEAKFEEARSLINLNKGLALEEFQELKKILEDERKNFREGSKQLMRLDEFIGKVEEEIGKLTDGATVNDQKELLSESQVSIYRDGNLFSVDKNGVINVLNENGDSQDEFETKNSKPIAITANDSSIYVLGNSGITRTTISNGNTSDAVENPDETAVIDLFGSNIYGLNIDTNSIDRYSGSSFTQGDYLDDDVKLNNPVSMAIDGSIWVIDDGKIRKFTRGAEDNFNVSTLEISNNSLIFTSQGYDNLYVVDRAAAKVYIISKSGNIENQYSWTTLSDTTSVSADEENNLIFISAGNKLYSFSFE